MGLVPLVSDAELRTIQYDIQCRAFCAQALTDLVALLADRFERETKARHLSARPSARTRAQLLVDTAQGLVLRARTGVPRKDLLRDARSYPPLILG